MGCISIRLVASALLVSSWCPSATAEPAFFWSNPIRFEGSGPERGRNELRDPCVIREMNGRFNLIFTADDWIRKEHNPGGDNGLWAFVGVADKVTGPYGHITCIDPMDVDKAGRVLGSEPSIGAMTVTLKNR